MIISRLVALDRVHSRRFIFIGPPEVIVELHDEIERAGSGTLPRDTTQYYMEKTSDISERLHLMPDRMYLIGYHSEGIGTKFANVSEEP